MEKKLTHQKMGPSFLSQPLTVTPFFRFKRPIIWGVSSMAVSTAQQVAVSALGSSEREAPEVPPILP